VSGPDSQAPAPRQSLGLVALVVREYEEALDFYLRVLGFELVEDTPVPAQGKRWVVVRPPGPGGAALLLARAAAPHQQTRVGDQTGGRVFLFLYTDDVDRDVAAYRSRGVRFVREPEGRPHGKVAVFADLYGNLWDLIEPAAPAAA
jgi:catechol 2,3-dioxygenase-like lactoylglutathione lyase family enzyme